VKSRLKARQIYRYKKTATSFDCNLPGYFSDATENPSNKRCNQKAREIEKKSVGWAVHCPVQLEIKQKSKKWWMKSQLFKKEREEEMDRTEWWRHGLAVKI